MNLRWRRSCGWRRNLTASLPSSATACCNWWELTSEGRGLPKETVTW